MSAKALTPCSLRERLLRLAQEAIGGVVHRNGDPLRLVIVRGGTKLVLTATPAELLTLTSSGALTACAADICTVLHEAGHGLTTAQVLEHLEQRGMIHGESTVRNTLARMRRDGVLTNEQNARPAGYGLPDGYGLPEELDGEAT